MLLEPVIDFSVGGTPEPAGSKRAFVPQKNGKPFYDRFHRIVVNVVDDNPKSKTWKAQVKAKALAKYRRAELETGALAIKVSFYVERPKGHFGTGKNADKLLPSARRHPTVKPDTTKLLRAVEDALTGVVWEDDAQIVSQIVTKAYGEQAGVRIEVFRIKAEVEPQLF